MADDFTINVGDTLPVFEGTLVPAAGQTFTLAGCTVRLRMWARSNPADKVYGLCTILDEVNRLIRYTWQPADTDTKGGYLARVEVTFPDGSVESLSNDRALVIRVSP